MRHSRGLGDVPSSKDSAYLKKDFFTYVTGPAATLAVAGSTTSTFNIDGDSDFFWTKMCSFALSADSGGTYLELAVASVDIIITDTTSGRQLMNSQVPVSSIAGTGQIPFILPIERYMESKSTIKVDYFNVGVEITLLRLSFIGIKAFKSN